VGGGSSGDREDSLVGRRRKKKEVGECSGEELLLCGGRRIFLGMAGEKNYDQARLANRMSCST
jgi:hypothetical protein